MGVSCASKSNPIDYPCSPSNDGVPWCYPGAAPVHSPCGVFAGGDGGMNGRNMLDLDGAPQAKWTRGTTADVGFSIIANHGGGYAFRLCPVATGARDADGRLEESCFAKHYLNFSAAHPNTSILDTTGATITTFPAIRVTRGTSPAGSQWTRNPVPLEVGMSAPIPPPLTDILVGRGPFPFTIQDVVDVPASLPLGHYVLSWRWDAEQTKQVWSHCSDIEVVDAAAPAAQATTKLATTYSDRTPCVGDSLGLDVNDCAAWIALYDALNGPAWKDETGASLSHMRLDPCSVDQYWKKSVVCVQYRGYMTITELYLMGDDLVGAFPASIASFAHLAVLSLVNSQIHGSIPTEIGELSKLRMIWLDHNAKLGGSLPASMSKLELEVLELHYSAFSGVLPVLPYATIPDCMLYVPGEKGNFACPLPPGAADCGAVCA